MANVPRDGGENGGGSPGFGGIPGIRQPRAISLEQMSRIANEVQELVRRGQSELRVGVDPLSASGGHCQHSRFPSRNGQGSHAPRHVAGDGCVDAAPDEPRRGGEGRNPLRRARAFARAETGSAQPSYGYPAPNLHHGTPRSRRVARPRIRDSRARVGLRRRDDGDAGSDG